ncbi:hypothetical protein SELMODRAFT_444972 [Selaginella moellendorffii]|uniref:Uncharacterized protein n=1 Tax=Selaginella moellendorffii TaxID=88036 RepID=D8SEC6_SELML|nr:protein NRT1/ PTR FAMILY 3.1 [Selaginella moellendorffii]XP_024542476.1 protein NRT1/ PTR FAMILY 3.1 [Selaginella moellendorffii]EFJ17180.1 hypothetical protein SELMODRAFT_444972 [Selaginella moellendorffii]|eukprot:XP_002981698.1 protein NRT1/ PTR FAMILY 3.1 [Selaginella moellendorffii]
MEHGQQVYWKCCSPLGFVVRRFNRRTPSDQGSATENEQLDGLKTVTRNKGGWKTTPFIIGNEISEKLAMIGLHVNLITYLVQQLNMSNVQAAVTLTNFNGLNNITPLLGAYVADAHLGRYMTIIIGSLTYAIGIVMLTIDATFSSLRPPHCNVAKEVACQPASSAQKAFLYISFAFFALGSGGIKPCVAAFGADQFDQKNLKQRKQSFSFFNWYFFGLGIAILLSVTVIVYVQEHVGWTWGFGIPAIAMVISVIFFLVGSPWYRHVAPNGSPFIRLLQVVAAAYRKRRLSLPEDPAHLHNVEAETGVRLQHTDQFRFLDKSACPADEDFEDGKPLPWRLCSVQQVEELKCIIRTSPIWATGIVFTLAHGLQNTFTIQQARSMDRHLRSFVIPPATFHVFGILTLLACVPLYDRVFMPLARKVTGHERGITFLQRIGIGLFISIMAMVVAAFAEGARRKAALNAGLLDHPHRTVPFSAFWLAPQFILIGMSESFVSIGHLEFFYDQFPEHLRSLASALFSSITALGSYLSSILVTVVNRETSRGGRVSWLSNNLNKGHLDYFYWLQAVLFAVNFVIFLFCARWYRYKSIIADEDSLDSEKVALELVATDKLDDSRK